MKPTSPVILTINRSDLRGGAATVAYNLFSAYKNLGHQSFYAVEHKTIADENIVVIDSHPYNNFWRKNVDLFRNSLLRKVGSWRGIYRIAKFLEWLAAPAKKVRFELGIEEFNYPGSRHILEKIPTKPDLVHAHVLHGGFFDLNYLKELSSQFPVFLTLHDAWMLSGHCAHSFECERWKIGCGHCPDLTIPPKVKRDATAYNWRNKNRLYKNSKFHIVTPSQWLMDKVNQSMLKQACVNTKVIPNGVNQEIFKPGNRETVRQFLELDKECFILLFSANGIRNNRWKDFEMMRKALQIVGEVEFDKKIIFLSLGETAPTEKIGNAEIRFMPYRADAEGVADFYRACDIYIHASKADTFPNAVLEALSCGAPVIGTAVGGIPEQINGWNNFERDCDLNTYSVKEATGILVKGGDADSLAFAITFLLNNDEERKELGRNAARDAKLRFPLEKQVNAYLDWYKEIVERNKNNQ